SDALGSGKAGVEEVTLNEVALKGSCTGTSRHLRKFILWRKFCPADVAPIEMRYLCSVIPCRALVAHSGVRVARHSLNSLAFKRLNHDIGTRATFAVLSSLRSQHKVQTADRSKIPHKMKNANASEIISVWKNITVTELAEVFQRDIDAIFEAMLYVPEAEQYDRVDSRIDNIGVVIGIAKRLGVRCTLIANPTLETAEVDDKDVYRRPPASAKVLQKRPPIVTIMGHVDHGKTTLLDTLRHSHVVDSEFGGITQHIGAFSVSLQKGETVTILDTPGHAAFSAMRARGAHCTDIVILVVAADDGVKEQTLESLHHAREAKVPIVVAINKMDKAGVDADRVKRELLQQGLAVEDFGGDVQAVPVSALTGENLVSLIEAVLAEAELLQLKADPTGPVEGVVIESRADQSRGKLATMVVQRGTLRKGSFLVAGESWAKVRAMFTDLGKPLQNAPPSTAVEVIGWRDLPSAGDEILEVESEKKAHAVVHWRKQKRLQEKGEQDDVVVKKKMDEHILEYRKQLEAKRASGKKFGITMTKPSTVFHSRGWRDHGGPKVALVLKGDVDGSVEALLDVIGTYHSPMCLLDVVHYGVGPVSAKDIEYAEAFDGLVYSFNVPVPPDVATKAKNSAVPIKKYNIIYRLIDDLKAEINSRLPPAKMPEIVGTADVLQEFLISDGRKKLPVAGCRCVQGSLKKKLSFRVRRNEEVIYDGAVTSIRHLKNEVESINKDTECGICFEDHSVRVQLGDVVECYEMVDEKNNAVNMVVGGADYPTIMLGMESTAGVRLNSHKHKLKHRFEIVRKLGQGTYGKVQLAVNRETGQEVAIKTIKKAKIETEQDLVRIRREIQIMSSVQHPSIIHIYEVFENREKMILVMEYASGGELYDYLSDRKVLAEEEARRIFRQISAAVYYCHKHKICHRDLKLENILLDDKGNAKIADFGLSNVFDNKNCLSTFCGSPLYASPEIVKGVPYYGPEVDCWSLGVLLYTLVYGAMPFDGSNFKRLVRQITSGEYFEPKKKSDASELIHDMLTVSAKRRANIEDICSHWWVNEGYSISCLEVADELACQTPVRLDLLLSIAPAPKSSEKLVVEKPETLEKDDSCLANGNDADPRSEPVVLGAEAFPEMPMKSKSAHQPKSVSSSTVPESSSVTKNASQECSIAEVVSSSSLKEASATCVQPASPIQVKPFTDDDDEPEASNTAAKDIPKTCGSEAKAEDVGHSSKEIPDSSVKDKAKKVKKKLTTEKTSKGNVDLQTISEASPEIAGSRKSSTATVESPKPKDASRKSPEATTPTSETPKKKVVKKVIKSRTAKPKEDQAAAAAAAPAPAKSTVEKRSSPPATSDPKKPSISRRNSKNIMEVAKMFDSSPAATTASPAAPTSSKTLERPKKVLLSGLSNIKDAKKAFEAKNSVDAKPKPLLLPSRTVSDAKRKFELPPAAPKPLPSAAGTLKSKTESKIGEKLSRIVVKKEKSPPKNSNLSEASAPKTPPVIDQHSVPEASKISASLPEVEKPVESPPSSKISPSSNSRPEGDNVSESPSVVEKIVAHPPAAPKTRENSELVTEKVIETPINKEAVVQEGQIGSSVMKTAAEDASSSPKFSEPSKAPKKKIETEKPKLSLKMKHESPKKAEDPRPNSTDTVFMEISPSVRVEATMKIDSGPENTPSTLATLGSPPTNKPSSSSSVTEPSSQSAIIPGTETSFLRKLTAPPPTTTTSSSSSGMTFTSRRPPVMPVSSSTVGSREGSTTPTPQETRLGAVRAQSLGKERLVPIFLADSDVPVNNSTLVANSRDASARSVIATALERRNSARCERNWERFAPCSGAEASPMSLQSPSVSSTSSLMGSLSSQPSMIPTPSPAGVSSSTHPGLKHSRREYIIPIALEDGGFAATPTPTPSSATSIASSMSSSPFFSRERSMTPGETTPESGRCSASSRTSSGRRMWSLFNEDDVPSVGNMRLQRLSSFGKSMPTSNAAYRAATSARKTSSQSKPFKSSIDRSDSFSSAGEEDDDEEGFEILTAESLFSTLLARVRSLSRRMNKDGDMLNRMQMSSPAVTTTMSEPTSQSSASWSERPLHTRCGTRASKSPVRSGSLRSTYATSGVALGSSGNPGFGGVPIRSTATLPRSNQSSPAHLYRSGYGRNFDYEAYPENADGFRKPRDADVDACYSDSAALPGSSYSSSGVEIERLFWCHGAIIFGVMFHNVCEFL
ncbi:unnamed protein product, partial [Notodromas monacha]